MIVQEKEKEGLQEVVDNLIKYRSALGFIADKLDDAQASAAVCMIEEGMEITENMLKFIMISGLAEDGNIIK